MPVVELLTPLYTALRIIYNTAVYWAPIFLLSIFIKVWLLYVQAKFRIAQKWALLEIKIPREINKSPTAMEIVFHAMHQTRDGTKIAQWFDGLQRVWFSLELVSIEGRVHFYIHTPRFFIDLIQSQIYSQYPEVEVSEVDDYTKNVDFGKEDSNWDIFGTEMKFDEPDPYPIKTYIDYKLDKEVKDDRVLIDPMAPLIELLGSIGPGEQMWVQIPIQAAKKRFSKSGHYFKKETWKDQGIELINKLRKRESKPGEIVVYDTKLLSPGEEDLIKSIERNIAKIGFDCGFRLIYLAKEENFKMIRVPSLVGSIKQFNAEDRNRFKPDGKRTTFFDYPWQDFRGIRLSRKKRFIFNAYKMRSYFYPPYPRKPMTLSVEELATLYHFPGFAIETPTFERLPSKTSEPPTNLPIDVK